MKKIISVLLLSVLFSASASAEFMIYGQGSSSCGEWVAENKKDSKEYYRLTDWLTGFITGFNYSGKAQLKKTDYDAMFLFVTNYCNANPLDRVSKAAGALVVALRVQE